MTALTTEELERIRFRMSWKRGYPGSRNDAKLLLAEVDRLSAQLQRCNTACDEAKRKAFAHVDYEAERRRQAADETSPYGRLWDAVNAFGSSARMSGTRMECVVRVEDALRDYVQSMVMGAAASGKGGDDG